MIESDWEGVSRGNVLFLGLSGNYINILVFVLFIQLYA